MDTLLSHEATGEDLWMTVTQRNWLVGHMIVTKWLKQNVQFHSFYTHSYYINGHKVSSNSNVVSIQTVRYFGRTAIYSMLYFNLFICLPNIFVPLTCNMNQIKSKSNHFYCHITTAQVPWWVKFLRACSRQCKKLNTKQNNNLHMDSTYIQTVQKTMCKIHIHILSTHSVLLKTYLVTNTPIHIIQIAFSQCAALVFAADQPFINVFSRTTTYLFSCPFSLFWNQQILKTLNLWHWHWYWTISLYNR